jgi:hypothetical protein
MAQAATGDAAPELGMELAQGEQRASGQYVLDLFDQP